MSYYKLAIKCLESSGYKVTNPRKQVLKALDSKNIPLSPYELQKIIKSKPLLNPVTIYRVLELLVELKLVHKVSSGGFLKCSLFNLDDQNTSNCHHFLICNDCGATKEFTEPHSHLHLPANLKSEFKVINHTYELNGLCKKCFH